MATHLSISIPVYKKDRWNRTERDGKLEVSSDVDSLSEGYDALKKQLDKLLAELDAQNRLAENAEEIERQIEQKAYALKRITEDIERATKHYEALKSLLKALGVDPRKPQLTFDTELLLNPASIAEVEVVKHTDDF